MNTSLPHSMYVTLVSFLLVESFSTDGVDTSVYTGFSTGAPTGKFFHHESLKIFNGVWANVD